MPTGQRPTVRKQRLGNELRRLRVAARKSMEEAGERIGGDKTKISRMETGKQGVSKTELEALLDLYDVTEAQVRTALETIRAQRRKKNWWQQYGEILAPGFQERLSIEADAVQVMAYQPFLVPGLLQTQDYAAESIRRVETSAAQEQIASYVSVRMERQNILQGEHAPQYVCVLDEAVLHREVGGPSVMAAQLRHLVEIDNPPKLSIQVIPFNQGWHSGLDGGFTIYSYPDPMDLDVVNLDYLDGALYLEEDGPVAKYRLAFDQLRSSALSSRQSKDLISHVARDLDKR